jgi:hypothetical protein
LFYIYQLSNDIKHNPHFHSFVPFFFHVAKKIAHVGTELAGSDPAARGGVGEMS